MFSFAGMIPLIGGMDIGASKAFNSTPEYLISYSPFINNDKHIVNYYNNEIPYYLVDKDNPNPKHVDIVHSTCPCAGLSQFSHGFGDHNENNKWMPLSTEYVLSTIKPMVLYGENAPGFAGSIGKNVRENLYKIAQKYNYSMTIYRTRSLLHGLSQVRERSFYFFWKGEKVPVFEYFNRPHEKIENTILNAKGNSQRECINTKTPSIDDPYYRYILEKIHNGITHREFCKIVEPANARGNDTFSYIERVGHDYLQVADWMKENGYEKEVPKCLSKNAKLKAGGNIMRRGTIVPRDYIGAFVGHYPTSLTHPIEDRYINYREAMTIMGLPDNFELLNPVKSVNHICQNVPVQTATDMANEVKESLLGNRPWINATYAFQYNHSKEFKPMDLKQVNLSQFFE